MKQVNSPRGLQEHVQGYKYCHNAALVSTCTHLHVLVGGSLNYQNS